MEQEHVYLFTVKELVKLIVTWRYDLRERNANVPSFLHFFQGRTKNYRLNAVLYRLSQELTNCSE